MTPEQIIDGLLAREGGFVNHPADKGGPTKYGITQGTLTRWRAQPCTAEDVEMLTQREAREIYRSEYIHRPGYDLLPEGPLQTILVDTAVQWGPHRATVMLQRIVGAKQDGVLGPATLAAVATFGYRTAAQALVESRREARVIRIADDPSQKVFAKGWANRDDEMEGLLA